MLSIRLDGNGNGSVRSSSPSFQCNAACTQSAPANTKVTIVAVPDASSIFGGWQGACSGSGNCSLTLDVDQQVTATFTAGPPPPPGTARVSIQLVGTGAGKVSSPAGLDCPGTCAKDVAKGTRVSLVAAADANSTFAGWGGACGGPGTCDFAVNADSTVWANFSAKPAPDDCAGLVPAAPANANAQHTITFDNSAGVPFCMPGFVDADGTLALDLWDGRPGYGRSVDFVGPTGARLASEVNGGQSVFTEQADGFVVLNFDGGGSWRVSRFDSQGQAKGTTPFFTDGGRGMALDPTGGAVVPRQTTSPSGAATSLQLVAYDAHLTERWHAVLPPEPVAMVAVDRVGNALAIIDGDDHYGPNTVAGIWVDHNGAVGPEFQISGPVASGTPAHLVTFKVAERVGSGLFIGSESRAWVAQLDSLSTTPAPPPAWLASRPVSEMHMVHGGVGYAVLPNPNPSAADCTQTIDVVSPSGKTCGSHTFRAAAGTCSTSSIRVGYDGTVVQTLPRAPTCSGRSCSCTWQWWSGFYR